MGGAFDRPRHPLAKPARKPRPYLVPRAELNKAAFVYDEDHVEFAQRAQAMRDDDDNGLSCPNVFECTRQRRFALGVQVCVGLIEHDEKRTTIKGPGETYALALARRQQRSALADLRGIAVGQRNNEVVCARHCGSFEYRFLANTVLEATDVVGDAALKQRDLLRQVSDVPPEPIAVPLVEARPIQSDLAVRGLPQPDDGLGQR